MRWLAVIAALGVLLAAGCAGTQERVAYMQAQLKALEMQLKGRKPILVIEAMPGQELKITGLKRLAVYAPRSTNPGSPLIKQYRDPWANVVTNGLGVVGAVAGIYVGGQAAVELADTVGRHAGVHISDALKTTGTNSPVGYTTGGGTGGSTITDSHNTTQ